MTIYGDLDVSTIDELPKDAAKSSPRCARTRNRQEAANFLRRATRTRPRRLTLVFPLIEESEAGRDRGKEAALKKWSESLATASGRLAAWPLSAGGEGRVMRQFRAGTTQVLVATTVIEVGIDVPNATVMLSTTPSASASRSCISFAAASGAAPMPRELYCFVKDKDEEAKARLLDHGGNHRWLPNLRRRSERCGPGDILGKAQSGQAPLLFAELLQTPSRSAGADNLRDGSLGRGSAAEVSPSSQGRCANLF